LFRRAVRDGYLGCVMKHYLGICLVLVTVAAIGLFALHRCTAAVDRTIDHVRDTFDEVLHVRPEITVNQRVVLTQTAPIAELAVVTREELVTIGLNAHLEVLSLQIPLTEKKLTAEAAYRIKAGFDLSKPFSVEVDPVTHALRAAMPHAEILSVEQVGDLIYHGENATLNRVTDDERSRILSSLNATAHDVAEKSTLKMEAEQQVAQRLKEIMGHNGQSLQIIWNDGAPVPSRN
jgi:hypothetical protein